MQNYLEQTFHRRDVTTPKMRAAIRDWFDLYYGLPRPGEDTADRLPVVIVNKLCNTVFAEYEPRVQGSAPAADWVRGNLKALDTVRRTAMQQAMVGGECLLKPVPVGGGFRFTPIRRDCFVPLGRDSSGRLTAVGTMEEFSFGGKHYLLLERRTAAPEGLTIENRLFEKNNAELGREVGLKQLPQTAALQPFVTLAGVPEVGFAVLRMPGMNCVDGSADAVSVYAPAVGLLRSLARCEEQLEAEFRNGASRVFASEDLLRPDVYGRRALQDDLFVGLPEDSSRVGLTVFSPELREESYLARKQDILRSCENVLNIRRGLLCDADSAERTATEVNVTNADYDLTIRALQSCWAETVQQAMKLCAALAGALGQLPAGVPRNPAKLPTVQLDWGDGVLFDRARVWEEYRNLVSDGLLRPELALAWYFDLPCETEEERAAIRARYMPD